MRQPANRFILLLFLALTVGLVAPRTRAWADDPRAEARTHYQAGVKFYGTGDYKNAIKEFSSAQQLAPADLNNYNLALCYDKLGDAEPAIQYYREYLNKVPNAEKRSEIEASVARLEGALKSAAAKKADEQRKADEAAKKADDQRKIDDAKKKADDARRNTGGNGGVIPGGGGVVGGVVGGAVIAPDGSGGVAPTATNVGSTGTPGTGQAVSTGDAQLDRVAGLDINAIRDQRLGGASSGMIDPRTGGPATAAPNGAGMPPNGAGMPPNGAGMPPTAGGPPNPSSAANVAGQGPADKPAPKEKPVYTKWWFWAVVAVSAYVVYEIATGSSNSANTGRELPLGSPGRGTEAGGVTLFHF